MCPQRTPVALQREANFGQQETLGNSRRKRKIGSLPTYKVLVVWHGCAIEAGDTHSRPGYQGYQACDKVQWFEDDVVGSVVVRCLQRIVPLGVNDNCFSETASRLNEPPSHPFPLPCRFQKWFTKWLFLSNELFAGFY